MRAVFGTRRTSPVTVAALRADAFDAVVANAGAFATNSEAETAGGVGQ
ncbi:MAG: hypothetical protein GX774_04040 [Armatimonadetes bacterium]|jgi:hypothetical protein|nr:hypothetical protein [Armatimonadota bacterium]